MVPYGVFALPQFLSRLDGADIGNLLRVSKEMHATIHPLQEIAAIPPHLSEFSANDLTLRPEATDRKLISFAKSRWGSRFYMKKIDYLGDQLEKGHYCMTSLGVDSVLFLYKIGGNLLQMHSKIGACERGKDVVFTLKQDPLNTLKMKGIISIDRCLQSISMIRESKNGFNLVLASSADLTVKSKIPLEKLPAFHCSSANITALIYPGNGACTIALHGTTRGDTFAPVTLPLKGKIGGAAIKEENSGAILWLWGEFGLVAYSLPSGETTQIHSAPIKRFEKLEKSCVFLDTAGKIVKVYQEGSLWQAKTLMDKMDNLFKIGTNELVVEDKMRIIMLSALDGIKAMYTKQEKKAWLCQAACSGGGFLALGVDKTVKLFEVHEKHAGIPQLWLVDTFPVPMGGNVQSLIFLKNGILIGTKEDGLLFRITPYEHEIEEPAMELSRSH